MKKILAVIKNIESDFKSENDKLNSFLELGTSYFIGNEFDKALGIFEKAIEEDPRNAGGWIGKAISHLAMTEVSKINSIDIYDYIQKGLNNTDELTIKKYLEAITLQYGYQFAAAIRLYIIQTNQAIAEKKNAQVAAVVGLTTAVIGGVVGGKSKGFAGTFIGYSMLTGGTAVTIKKGYDSFTLDQLSKSLYGNALAQAIISVPTMQSCFQIFQYSNGDEKDIAEAILDSWKESAIYLFKNEKEEFLKLVSELNHTDHFLDKEKRIAVQNKIDEILYFMDMIGLDESASFKQVKALKNNILSFTENFTAENIEAIINKRKKAQTGCSVVGMAIMLVIFFMDEAKLFTNRSPVPGLVLIAGAILVFRYYATKLKKINDKSGVAEVQTIIKQIVTKFKRIVIKKDNIDLKSLGI